MYMYRLPPVVSHIFPGGQVPEIYILTLILSRATTLNEYRSIEKDVALARRFQPIQVNEPTIQDTISILRGIKEKYEVHHGVRITDVSNPNL